MRGTLSDSFIEKVLLSVASFSVLSLFFSFLGMPWGPGTLAVLLILCYAVSHFGRMHAQLSGGDFQDTIWSRFLFWIFLSLGFLHLLFYFTETTGSHFISNLNINGDWPYHLNQILYLSRTQKIWPENPILAAEPMRYAFGMNWFSAMGAKAGIPLQIIIMISGSLSLWMTASLLKKSYGGWGLLALFASGGGWGMSLAVTQNLWGPSSQLAWKNLFLAVYMPQRGFWFALPCGLYLLRYLMSHWQERKGLRFPWSFIFLWAVMPFFHLHTFVALSALIFVTVLHQRAWFSVFKFLPLLPLPLFFILKSASSENVGSSLRWTAGWMTGSIGVGPSWLLNFGPWLAILLATAISVFMRKGQRFIFASVFSLAVLFNFLILAPWDWDQIKIVIWMYLALSYFMARESERLTEPLIGLALMILIHWAGILQFSGGIPSQMKGMALWSLSDQKSVQQLLKPIPVDERILMAPEPHHPIWSSGRAVVAGYEGHIWAHGVSTEGLKASILDLFNGQQIQSLRFSKMSANYLLWGPLEKKWFGVETPSEALWTRINSVGSYSLYSRLPVAAPMGN